MLRQKGFADMKKQEETPGGGCVSSKRAKFSFENMPKNCALQYKRTMLKFMLQTKSITWLFF